MQRSVNDILAGFGLCTLKKCFQAFQRHLIGLSVLYDFREMYSTFWVYKMFSLSPVTFELLLTHLTLLMTESLRMMTTSACQTP